MDLSIMVINFVNDKDVKNLLKTFHKYGNKVRDSAVRHLLRLTVDFKICYDIYMDFGNNVKFINTLDYTHYSKYELNDIGKKTARELKKIINSNDLYYSTLDCLFYDKKEYRILFYINSNKQCLHVVNKLKPKFKPLVLDDVKYYLNNSKEIQYNVDMIITLFNRDSVGMKNLEIINDKLVIRKNCTNKKNVDLEIMLWIYLHKYHTKCPKDYFMK